MATRYKPLEKLVSGVGRSATGFEMDYEGHTLVTDEPEDRNGTDRGPPPFDTFLAVLGGCSHVILGLIAGDLGVRIEDVRMRQRTELDINGIYGLETVTRPVTEIDLEIAFRTDATDDQIAVIKSSLPKRCPVFVVLTQAGVVIRDKWSISPLR